MRSMARESKAVEAAAEGRAAVRWGRKSKGVTERIRQLRAVMSRSSIRRTVRDSNTKCGSRT